MANQIRHEGDHDNLTHLPLVIQDAVQLEIVHHNDVAGRKTHDPVTHTQTPAARDGRINLQSLVPVEPSHTEV